MEYQKEQLKEVLKEHNFVYPVKIKFWGTEKDSNYLDLTEEQLKQIEKILN